MNVRTQFDLFLDKIRPHIIDYLESKGYNTGSAIRCINPEHDDHSPSMLCAHAEENDWRVWCTSCGWRGDIFDVYAAVEEKPKKGPNWLNETVLPLATMFNIPPPVIELTANEQFCHDLYRTFEDVAALISHDITKFDLFPSNYIGEKRWTQETLTALDIGVLPYEVLRDKIPEEERRRFGLNVPNVFDKSHLIFTVRDQFGRPVRFFARRPDENPKFVSTTSANLVVDVWRGRGHTYLANLCSRKNSTAILVEGHPDAVTLYQEGIQNVVGLCGCKAFSEAHADALTMSGISRCIVMYDGDLRGQEAAESLLRKEFVKSGGINYEVVVLPDDHDPDSYMRVEGEDRFDYLLQQKLSAFEFLLSKEDPSQTPEEICERLIPYIASARSDVKREMMARDLVAFTGERISVGAILADVARVDDLVISAVMEKQKAVIGATVRSVQNHSPQAKEIFRDALDKLEHIEKEQGGKGSKAACLARIQSCKMVEENRSTGGYTLNPNSLGPISDMLEGGDWRGSKIFVVAGVRNVGKSTFVDNFIWEAITNPDNHAIAFLLSIDDPIEARLRRMGCCAVRELDFTQNMMANPNYYGEELGHADVYEKREYAYSRLTEMVASGKLIIEDSRDGTTLAYAERRLAQIRRENPESNIIFGLDNFHDCTDWAVADVKDRVGKQIKYGKRICEVHKALGLFTAEYRKLSDPAKPGTDDDLADCLTEDSEIINYATGSVLKIRDVQPGMVVQSINTATLLTEPRKVLRRFRKGRQPCYRVTLEDGAFIEGTAQHKLLSDNDQWLAIDSLKEGSYVAIPNRLETTEPLRENSISEDRCRLLGYLAGDGNYGKKKESKDTSYYTPRFTNNDNEIIKDISRIIKNEFGETTETTSYSHRNATEMRIRRKIGSPRENQVRNFLKQVEIDGQVGSDKKIPDCIFSATNAGKANYLAGLFLTDGSVSKSRRTIRFFSKSQHLAYGTRTLLLQLSIHASITKNSRGVYHLLILRDSIEKFRRTIPLIGRKKSLLDSITTRQKNSSSYDDLPPSFSNTLYAWRRKGAKPTRIPIDVARIGYQVIPGKRVTRDTARQFASTEYPESLQKYITGECSWRKIKSIEDIGEQETFDLEIEETHNFIANGIVCHNSRAMAYAPHLTLHLFSDLDQKGEDKAICIHNHNGQIMPRVRLNVGKNKVTSMKGSNRLAFDFFPGAALFEAVPLEQAKLDEKVRKEELAQKKKQAEAIAQAAEQDD